jgi:hypothetical protein
MFLICGVGGRLTGRAASVYVPQTIAGKSRSVEPAGRAAGLRSSIAAAFAATAADRAALGHCISVRLPR